MANFFVELKRRHIYRVAAAYAVVAWGLLQIVNNVAPIMEAPPWVAQSALLFLALGFPIALLFAWMRDLPSDDGATARARTGVTDWALLGALAAVIGIFAYQQFGSRPGATTAPQAGVQAARAAAAAPAGISVAVMPFNNLSDDKQQEYFSDGMTEDIITALAKIPDLRVVARESAFEYNGEKSDSRAVGQALNATHLIEGSVRKAGTRVRITAQLVKAEDGVNIWAESYDRELTDVFAIQEDIARAIAASLRMPLGLKPGENLVSNRPKDQQTYEIYLKGVNALRTRSRQELDLLGQVVTRDPNYAPGWVKLSQAQVEMRVYYERRGETEKKAPLLQAAEASAKKSIALAPDFAGAYAALALVVSNRGQFLEAADFFQQGLARDMDDPELLNGYSGMMWTLGYIKQALDLQEKVTLLEPLVPLYNRQRGQLLLTSGMTEEGIKLLEIMNRERPGLGGLFLSQSYAQHGRFAEAAKITDDVLADPNAVLSGVFSRPLVQATADVLHAAANKSEPPARLPDLYSEQNFVYAYTKTPERMLDWPEKALKEGDYRPLRFTWWPMPAALRKTERFKKLVRDAGLVEYWKARGWPDLCHPQGATDFACE